MARRFVAGERLDEALAAARVCNDHGMMVSLDYLGENVSSTADAQNARDAYLGSERNAPSRARIAGALERSATWNMGILELTP